jgi:hypothetical protein
MVGFSAWHNGQCQKFHSWIWPYTMPESLEAGKTFLSNLLWIILWHLTQLKVFNRKFKMLTFLRLNSMSGGLYRLVS